MTTSGQPMSHPVAAERGARSAQRELSTILEHAARTLGVERVAVALHRAADDSFELAAEFPSPARALPGPGRSLTLAEAGTARPLAAARPGGHAPRPMESCGEMVARSFRQRRTVLEGHHEITFGDGITRVMSCVATPIVDGAEVLGVMIVGDLSGRRFGSDEIERLERIAPLASLAILQARMFARMQREHQIVQALADVRAAATHAVDPTVCGTLICGRLEGILPGARVSMYLLDGEGAFVRLLAAGSPHEWHQSKWREIPTAGDHIVARALKSGDPQRVMDHPSQREWGMVDSVAVGLRDGARPLGVLLTSAAKPFEHEAIEVLAAGARSASVGIALALGIDHQRRAERRARLVASLALADPPEGVRRAAATAWLRGLSRGVSEALEARCLLVPGPGSGESAQTGPVLDISNAEFCLRARGEGGAVRDPAPSRRLAVAVREGADVLGVLFLSTTFRPVDADDEALLTTIASRVAAAVERGRLGDARRRAEREKDEVLSIVAHELRTPITSLRGFAAATLDRFGDSADPRIKRAFEVIERQAMRMSNLVEELLDVSRIERGQLELRRADTDLAEVARDVIERVGPTAPRHPIRLEGAATALALADATRLEQVLTNLITNAVRYSPTGGAIVVRVGADASADEGGPFVRVDVCDSGVGVMAADRSRIFERFQRSAGPEGHSEPGLGLGLYIARQIVERHGGRLWLDASEVGRGSTFSFRVPVRGG